MLQAIKSSPFVRSFRDKRLFWYYVAVAVGTVWCVLLYEPAWKIGSASDRHIRIFGMTLQLIGAWTVWHDLTSTAREYGDGPSWSKTWEYIKYVFVKQPPTMKTVYTDFTGSYAVLSGRTRSAVDPSQPVEARIARLETLADAIDNELIAARREITTLGDMLAAVKGHAQELQRGIASVEGRLKRSLIGNAAFLDFGVVCLVLGIILTSIPAEILEGSAQLILWKDELLQYLAD